MNNVTHKPTFNVRVVVRANLQNKESSIPAPVAGNVGLTVFIYFLIFCDATKKTDLIGAFYTEDFQDPHS